MDFFNTLFSKMDFFSKKICFKTYNVRMGLRLFIDNQ